MKKKIAYLCLLILCSLGLSACSSKKDDNTTEEKTSILEQQMDEITGTEFQKIASSDTMELLLKPDQGVIRWQSKTDGTYYDTKLFDGTDNMRSDLNISYYAGTPSNVYARTETMDSYTMSVAMENVHYQRMDNGIRIIYEMGDESKTYKDFPKYISQERMEELVFQYLDATQINIVKTQYAETKGGLYSRKATKDSPMKKLAANQLYELFYEIGHYTYDDLAADNAEFEIEGEEPTNYTITVPMEFYLEGNDLIVKVLTDQIESTDKEKIVASLDILPYFLSTSDTDGYMMVPDGGGALINLNNIKLNEAQFSSRFYGGDKLVNANIYSDINIDMMMPVFGLKASDHGVFAIIEEGAEAAVLSAYINGSYQNEKISRMALTFNIREYQRIKSNMKSSSKDFYLEKTTEDYYNKNIIIRYHYLPKEKADYVNMAEYYKKYLEEKGTLTKKSDEENAPFYLELLGATDKTKRVLGIPYEGTEVLTSFKDAKNILMSLYDSGVNNIKLIYSGMVNKGLNQREAKKVSVVSELGGKSGWKSLLSYAEGIGVKVYPNVKLQTAYTKKGLSTDQISYFITDERAILYNFDPIQNRIITDDIYQKYMISPAYFTNYINKFAKSYQSLGISNLASDDLMSFLLDTYQKNNHISQTTAKESMIQAVEKLSSDKSLMLSNPVDLAYAYTDYIIDIPTDHSGLKVLDQSIPFMQMVLNGYIPYSSTTVNKDSLDISDNILKAVEGKASLKFSLLSTEAENLKNTKQNDRFGIQFNIWEEKIKEYYDQYNSFYQKVKDASIIEHQILDDAGNLRMETYSNGVKVYLNYGDEEASVSGVTVAPHSYVVK